MMASPQKAPLDAYGAERNDQTQAERDIRAEASLDEALEESFPASDPVSSNRFD